MKTRNKKVKFNYCYIYQQTFSYEVIFFIQLTLLSITKILLQKWQYKAYLSRKISISLNIFTYCLINIPILDSRASDLTNADSVSDDSIKIRHYILFK